MYHYRIDGNGVIKVADFGLSVDVYSRNYFKQVEGNESQSIKLPIKWMALESIHDGIFSEKTDVVSLIYSTNNFYTLSGVYNIVVIWDCLLGDIQSW